MDRETLRLALVQATGCEIQHDGWPCGTCFHHLFRILTHQHWLTLIWFRYLPLPSPDEHALPCLEKRDELLRDILSAAQIKIEARKKREELRCED